MWSPYMVQTTHDSSAPSKYGGQNIPTQIVSMKYNSASKFTVALPTTDSAFISTQSGTRLLWLG